MTEREFALDVVRKLQQAGFTALWAGGCVRDELLGLIPADYDIATNAVPKQLPALFKHRNEIGASFGVVQVIGPRGDHGEWLTVEVATFRSDGIYSDGRRPDTVVFSSPEHDAQRRDFTINGMFFDPVKGELIDFVGGQTDLQAKVLRAIGNASERFTEDKLRILRAVRMATRFELAIEPDTQAAAKRMASQIRAVSPERIAEELRKLLTHRNRVRGLRLLREFDLIEPVLPELVPMFTLPQGLPAAPTGTLWEHTVRVVEELAKPNPPTPFPAREGGENAKNLTPQPPSLRVNGEQDFSPSPLGGGVGEGSSGVSFPLAFAAILHDVGKPSTCARTPDRYTFHRHEHVGKQMAEAIADRLRLSTAEKTRIAWLVEKHQYLAEAPTMRASKLKPILVHPGIRELLELHRADAVASGKSLDHVAFCERMLRDTPPEELNPAPAVTGEDLIAIGMKPGREFKRLLDAVRDAQLEGQIRTKPEGLQLVRELQSEQSRGSETPPE